MTIVRHMARIDQTAILKRIAELLKMPSEPHDDALSHQNVMHQFSSTLTLASLVYGPSSVQAALLVSTDKAARAERMNAYGTSLRLLPAARGLLETMKSDVEAGLVGSLEQQGAGMVLADMLTMAKDALVDPGGLNVAAVLAAASYEDTIRRMGESLAEVVGRPQLSSVLDELKRANVLVGAAFTTAQGYLKFRNDALHADWQHLNAAVVGSCIAFVERLVMEHFT